METEGTRARIIAATVELLEAQGYHATGLNQILQQSATQKGSFYHHFPGGKEALAAEAVSAVEGVLLLCHAERSTRPLEQVVEELWLLLERVAKAL